MLPSQNGEFYVSLATLPSTSNTNENEPDNLKCRDEDFLMPSLAFFADESNYLMLTSNVGRRRIRSSTFQKEFAKQAAGVMILEECAIGATQGEAVHALENMIGEAPKIADYLQDNAEDDGRSFYIVFRDDSHKFIAGNTGERDEWVKRIRELQKKRDQVFNANRKNILSREQLASMAYANNIA